MAFSAHVAFRRCCARYLFHREPRRDPGRIVALGGYARQDRLFALLSGDRQPESGELLIGGQPKRFRSPYDAVREGVVLVPGDRPLALLPNLLCA
ncbi:MAG: hypothetical protein R2932_21125 [Caldilineaceae bacterium]